MAGFEQIESQLNLLRRQENKISVLDGILKLTAVAIFSVFLFAAIEAIAFSGPAVRVALLVGLAAVTVAAAVYFVLLPVLRFFHVLSGIRDIELARQVGRRYPEVKDRLANVIELCHGGKTVGGSYYSTDLIQAAVSEIEEIVRFLDFKAAASFDRLRKAGTTAAYVVVPVVILSVVFGHPLMDAGARLLHPLSSFQKPVPFTLEVHPGNTEILKGASVEFKVVPKLQDGKKMPDRVSLLVREIGVNTYREEFLKREGNSFSLVLSGLRQSAYYYASAEVRSRSDDPIISDQYFITVVNRPLVKNLRVQLNFPAYSRLQNRSLDDNIGDINALKGTRAWIGIESNKALKSASLVFDDGTSVDMEVQHKKAKGTLVVKKTGSYHVRLLDQEGIESDEPIEYRLTVLSDEYPSIAHIEPSANYDLDDQMMVPNLLEVADDFGFSKLLLHYRLAETKSLFRGPDEDFKTTDLTHYLVGTAVDQEISFLWDLKDLDLAPEDRVAYFFEVFDNDFVSGPKSTRSEQHFLRFPSLEEIFAEATQQQDQSIESLESMSEESQLLKENLEEIKLELQKSKQMEWEDKEKVEDLVKKQEKMLKQIEEMKEALDQMTQNLDQNNMISEETAEKYLELQKMMEEINNEEFREAMKKLQEALQNSVSEKQLQDAMKNFSFDQEQFMKNIERTLNLLKQIKAEQKFDELVKKAEALEKKQEALKEATKQLDEKEGKEQKKSEKEKEALAKEQESLKKDLDNLSEESKKLQELLKELQQNLNKDLDQAVEKMESGDIQKQLQKAAEMLKQDKLAGAQDQQQKNQDLLNRLKNQLQQSQQAFNQQYTNQVLNAFRQIIYSLVEVSKTQELLHEGTTDLIYNSPQYIIAAQEQADLLGGVTRVTDDLVDLSNKTFAITPELGKTVGRAYANMKGAIDNLTERKGYKAHKMQYDAMIAVNDAIKLLLQGMQNMQQSGSGSGMAQLMQQLQQMAQQQQGLNDQTMPFGPRKKGQSGPPNGGFSQKELEELAQLAAQQKALRDALEKLQEQHGNQGGMANKLDGMAKEMEDVIKDLQDQNVDQKTLDRQKKILQRMLDAQKSVNTRKYSKKRKGESGKQYKSASPDELPADLTQRKNKLRQDLLKAVKEGYAKDYQDLIKQYFQALTKEDVQE